MADRINCGGGKKVHENLLSVTVNPDILNDHIEEYQGHKFVRLTVFIADKPDQYGKDVKVSINNWKPEDKKKQEPVSEDDPF